VNAFGSGGVREILQADLPALPDPGFLVEGSDKPRIAPGVDAEKGHPDRRGKVHGPLSTSPRSAPRAGLRSIRPAKFFPKIDHLRGQRGLPHPTITIRLLSRLKLGHERRIAAASIDFPLACKGMQNDAAGRSGRALCRTG